MTPRRRRRGRGWRRQAEGPQRPVTHPCDGASRRERCALARNSSSRNRPRCEDARVPAPCPLVLDDPARVGLLGAELVANRLRARPGLRLLLPTGRTPEGMYAALRALAAEKRLPTEQASVFQLDEYAGLGHDDERSFAVTLTRELRGLPF